MGIHFLYSLKSCFCFVKLQSVKIHELIKFYMKLCKFSANL